MRANNIVLGTRGSELARAQTRLVEEALRAAAPGLEVETKIISTQGDESGATVPVANFPSSQNGSLRRDFGAGRKGVFTREIEESLRRGEIDAAVHSAKDLPSESREGLEICATLPRASVDDAFITKDALDLESLPQFAKIATGSVRRRHQLQWKRRDLRVLELRGNVPTRLHKLIKSDWNAIVLARAGLERLGHDLSRPVFDFAGHSLHHLALPCDDFLPAGGQGIIAIQVRSDDNKTKERVQVINHVPTLSCLRAEREFLRLLQGDCNSPVAVLATIESEIMTVRAQVFEASSAEPNVGKMRSSLREQEPEKTAAALYRMMYGEE